MSQDITSILQDWEYDPDHTTRILLADDGRSVLQVRLPLGIEQYELDGRPDGGKPMGHGSAVEAMQAKVAAYVEEHGSDEGFMLTHDDCVLLQNEGVLFYYRYLLLFQMNDFERVARDTGHNLQLCGLLENYCESEEDRNSVLQFKPYIVRMNAMARAMTAVQNGSPTQGKQILTRSISEIESLQEIDSPAFQFERIRSVNYLKSALKQIDEHHAGPEQKLEEELKNAVEREDYERAAEIRDKLKEIG